MPEAKISDDLIRDQLLLVLEGWQKGWMGCKGVSEFYEHPPHGPWGKRLQLENGAGIFISDHVVEDKTRQDNLVILNQSRLVSVVWGQGLFTRE